MGEEGYKGRITRKKTTGATGGGRNKKGLKGGGKTRFLLTFLIPAKGKKLKNSVGEEVKQNDVTKIFPNENPKNP